MPLAQITLIEGRSSAQKAKMIELVTEAIVASIDVPVDTVRVLIQEIPGENWGIAGKPKFPTQE